MLTAVSSCKLDRSVQGMRDPLDRPHRSQAGLQVTALAAFLDSEQPEAHLEVPVVPDDLAPVASAQQQSA
jgi:hypothetical protein